MLQEIVKKAKELGYNKVYLWTDQAPEFYKKIGYTYLQQVEKMKVDMENYSIKR